jgi:hypothetical protein
LLEDGTMRYARLVAVAALGISLAGCISSDTLIKVKADGSGTIETTTVMSSMFVSQMTQMAAAFGGKEGEEKGKSAPPELFSMDDMKAAAAKMGEGVRFVSGEKIKNADGEGMKAVYAFSDITKLKVNQKPSLPGGGAQGAGLTMTGSAAEDVTFRLARQPNGDSLLTLVFPQLAARQGKPAPPTAPSQTPDPQQLEMMKTLFKGMRIALAVEVDGRIVKTNSAYVSGSRVTVLEMDFEQLLSNPALMSQMSNMKTLEEAKQTLKDVKGFKMNLDPELNIEFAGK